MHDVLIIGGGTAGMTAAIYTIRNGLDTLLLEGLMPGGQIINTTDIENYPGLFRVNGPEYSQKLSSQVKELGGEITTANVESITKLADGTFSILASGKEYLSKTVIFATGCTPKNIGCKNESSYVGRGVSYCAHCDGNFFRGKNVAVVGGGNTALEDALFLSNVAKHVYLIHRREGFRAAQKSVDHLREQPNVTFCLNEVVENLEGEPVLSNIILRNTITHETSTLAVNGVFVAIGQTPQTQLVRDLLPLDEVGYVKAGEECTTDVPGLFVAGDVRTKSLRQLVTAASDGAYAAVAATNYILG